MILSSIKQIENISWIGANNQQKVHGKINKRYGTKRFLRKFQHVDLKIGLVHAYLLNFHISFCQKRSIV